MKLAEVLWGPEAWCQLAYERGGAFCLYGALAKIEGVTFGSHSWQSAKRLLDVTGGSGIASWNDDPSRTWDEVAAAVSEYDRLTMLEELRSVATVTP